MGLSRGWTTEARTGVALNDNGDAAPSATALATCSDGERAFSGLPQQLGWSGPHGGLCRAGSRRAVKLIRGAGGQRQGAGICSACKRPQRRPAAFQHDGVEAALVHGCRSRLWRPASALLRLACFVKCPV